LARRFVRKVAIAAIIEGHGLLVMALDILARNRDKIGIDIHSGGIHCGGLHCGGLHCGGVRCGVRVRARWDSRGGEETHQRFDFRREPVRRVIPSREDLIKKGVAYMVMPAKKLPLATPAMEEMKRI
jgi:hypothetical protein